MIRTTTLRDPQVSAALLAGELVVLKTDTIYGIVARAGDATAVEQLYRVRRRQSHKSCILLVADLMGIPELLPSAQQMYHQLHRERPTTLVSSVPDNILPHLVRTDGTLAFRLVSDELADLIHQTGPLLAPSANPEGLPPATTVSEAVTYFGEAVSVYVDSGRVADAAPSRIVRLEGEQVRVLRD